MRVVNSRRRKRSGSGDESKEEPPVPMPNTEVKLFNVDGTWRETARESRKLPEPSFRKEMIMRVIIFCV